LFKFSSTHAETRQREYKKEGREEEEEEEEEEEKMAPTTAQHMSQRHQQMQQQNQPQQPDPSVLSAQAALNIEDSPPVHIVQIAALVLHCSGGHTNDRS